MTYNGFSLYVSFFSIYMLPLSFKTWKFSKYFGICFFKPKRY